MSQVATWSNWLHQYYPCSIKSLVSVRVNCNFTLLTVLTHNTYTLKVTCTLTFFHQITAVVVSCYRHPSQQAPNSNGQTALWKTFTSCRICRILPQTSYPIFHQPLVCSNTRSAGRSACRGTSETSLKVMTQKQHDLLRLRKLKNIWMTATLLVLWNKIQTHKHLKGMLIYNLRGLTPKLACFVLYYY